MRRNSKQDRDRERAELAKLTRVWRQWHHEERDAVLAGPHGGVLGELFRMAANLQHVRPAQLIGFIGTIDWTAIDARTRSTVLHEVGTAITKFREQQGLPPFDDPLDDRPNAFRAIHKIIIAFPASAGEPAGDISAKHEEVNP